MNMFPQRGPAHLNFHSRFRTENALHNQTDALILPSQPGFFNTFQGSGALLGARDLLFRQGVGDKEQSPRFLRQENGVAVSANLFRLIPLRQIGSKQNLQPELDLPGSRRSIRDQAGVC